MNPASGGRRLRAVVDTNVYISAFLHPDRPIFQIVQLAAEGRYRLLTSPAIIREVGNVLKETFGIEEPVRIRRLKALAKIAEIITPTISVAVIKHDPPDNRVLECAIEGRADLIVSGDPDLRRLRVFQSIPIVRPVDFLRTLGVLRKE